MNYTKKELFDRFEALPDDIQEAFLSVDTYDTMKGIVEKHKLHVDQAGKLSEQVGLLMLGLLRPENFLGEVVKGVGVSIDEAGEIAKEVNAKIFFPIRASLERIEAEGKADPYRAAAPQVENFSPAGNVSDANIEKAEEPLPNPGNNAIIVNKPVPETASKEPKDAGRNIFDEKMSKLFRLPKEEIDLGGAPSSPNSPKAPDPYRETLN